jgi:hypothetical protein
MVTFSDFNKMDNEKLKETIINLLMKEYKRKSEFHYKNKKVRFTTDITVHLIGPDIFEFYLRLWDIKKDKLAYTKYDNGYIGLNCKDKQLNKDIYGNLNLFNETERKNFLSDIAFNVRDLTKGDF